MSKIYVIEPNMNSFAHSEVNAGLLYIFEKTFEGEKNFISSEKHSVEINKIYNLKNWNLNKIDVPTFNIKKIFFLDFLLFIRLFSIYIKLNKDDHFFVLGSYPITLVFFSYINILFKKKVIVVLHGQMECFLENSQVGLSKYYYRLCKFVFKRNDGLRYIVLGESINKNIDFLFKKRSKRIVIDQPYFFNNEIKSSAVTKNLKLCFLGRFDKTKNVEFFFNLLDKLKDLINSNVISVTIIGKVDYFIEEKYRRMVKYSNEVIDNSKFEELVNEQDYVLSFTDERFYKAIPSGVFFDCIKFSKPLIAIPNDFINHYFERYAPLGYLCTDVDDMFTVINNIIETNKKADFYENFNLIRESLSLENIADSFKKQL